MALVPAIPAGDGARALAEVYLYSGPFLSVRLLELATWLDNLLHGYLELLLGSCLASITTMDLNSRWTINIKISIKI